MAEQVHHSNGYRKPAPKTSREIEQMVRRQLDDVGKVVWGTRLRLWSRYYVQGYVYDGGGYWWVSGPGEDGRTYQWDVVYEAQRGEFLVGHARGNIKIEGITEHALENALRQAMDIGPIEQTPGSGFVS